jgi:hypothetical protein
VGTVDSLDDLPEYLLSDSVSNNSVAPAVQSRRCRDAIACHDHELARQAPPALIGLAFSQKKSLPPDRIISRGA